jgi:hypothetical protein
MFPTTQDATRAKARGKVAEVIFVGAFRKYEIALPENLLLILSETTLHDKQYNIGDECYCTGMTTIP